MNMRKYIRIMGLATMFSFIWGLWWGYKKMEMRDPIKNAKVHLRVLAPENIFSEAFLHSLLVQRRVHLEVDGAKSPQDFLHKLYANQQSFDLIFFSSFLTESIVLDRQFAVLDDRGKRVLQSVSFDFLNLSFDPSNQYVIPFLWGVNGFLAPPTIDVEVFSLSQLAKDGRLQNEASLLKDPTEVFTVLKKLVPVLSTWVDTGQKDEVKKSLRTMRSMFSRSHDADSIDLENKNIKYTQVSSGRAADFIKDGKWKFALPVERANLWLILAAINKSSLNQKSSEIALEILAEPKWAIELAQSSQEAGTLSSLNAVENLPAMRKPSYIRALPMSRIELYSRHEIFEPTFMESVREELSLFK